MTRTLVALVLVWFGYQTAVVLGEHGYAGFFERAQANTATNLLLLDVTIFVVLSSVWIIRDARRPWIAAPFVALAAVLGAAGPLLYLLLRRWVQADQPPAFARGADSTSSEV